MKNGFSEKIIKSHAGLVKIVNALKGKGKKIVFTNGCFDILHVGHVDYLAKARSLGDTLIVGLNSDKSVRTIKGSTRPLNSENDRARVLAALSSVDYIAIFNKSTPEELIAKVRPGILVKGGDWKKEYIAGSKFVKSSGGRVIIIPFVAGYSTTSMINKMKM